MAANIVKYILDIDSKKAKTGLKNLTNESKNTSKSLEKLSDASEKSSRNVKKTGQSAIAAGGNLKKFATRSVAAIAVVTGALAGLKAVGEAAFDFTREAVDAINRLNDLSTASNLSAETIQAVSLAFEASGQSASQADTFIKKFPQRLADIRKEGSDSNLILKQMGIEIGNASDGYRSSDAVFKDIITTLQNMEDAELRTAAAQRIFKRDVGNLLVALGNTGPIENFIAFTKKFGVDTKTNAAAAAEFQQKIAALGLAFAFARDRVVSATGGYQIFNKILAETIGTIVFVAEMVRLFSKEIRVLGTAIFNVIKGRFKFFIEGLKLIGKVAPAVADDLGNLIQSMTKVEAGSGIFQNTSARISQAKQAAQEAKNAIAGFNKSIDNTSKTGKTAGDTLKDLKKLFEELDNAKDKSDKKSKKKGAKSEAQKEAERLLKAQEKAKEKLSDLIKTLEMGDITIEGALKKTGSLIRLFEKVKLPTESIEQFQQKLELDIFKKSIDSFEKEMKDIQIEFGKVNIDQIMKDIKNSLAITAIDFGVQLAEAISGSAGAIQSLATMFGGPVTGAIVGALGSVSSIGQQLKEVGNTALETVKERELKRREEQKGSALTEGEKRSIENLEFLTAAEQRHIVKEAQLEDARVRVENFVEGFAIALEVLPAILIRVLPGAIANGIKGLLQAIFDLPKTLGREILAGLDRFFTDTGEKAKNFFIGAIDTSVEAVTLGFAPTQTYDSRRSGGKIPSYQNGMRFTGTQKSGLALLHENEFVVPASGQKPQSVVRTMNQQSSNGITVNVSGMVVESNAVDQIVREIERRFSTFGTSQSTLFGS